MGRNKHNALATAAAGRSVKERHQRSARDNIIVPRNLAALPEKNIKSKHQSYFQFFENKDRKDKKLEFQVTTDPNPPPGFEFVPSGNPELTKACKELSREQDALVFIVSGARDAHNHDDDNIKKLALHVHRMGHHIRQTIVEQAKALVGKEIARTASDNWQLPETQEEINAQAEAALRDLFPRIPNFDKQMIIEHSFKKGEGYGKPKVGTSDLPLYRRVQLAVLAHIRHTHTRYDKLLREIDWHVARKVVEETCLDILVKWRGDEETGRDQLDDILREVVVISDDSDDTDDSDDSVDADDTDDDRDEETSDEGCFPVTSRIIPASTASEHADASALQPIQQPSRKRKRKAKAGSNRIAKHTGAAQPTGANKNKRGFKRYEAVQKRWEEAVNRNRHTHNAEPVSHVPMDKGPSRLSQQRGPSVEVISSGPRTEPMRVNRLQPVPQSFYPGGQEHGHHIRAHETHAANSYREERTVPERFSRDPYFDSSAGTVVGRRVGRLPPDSRAAHGPGSPHHHFDLQDLLVPSVEPISPNSRPDAPQAMPRFNGEEPIRPEQVPAVRNEAPAWQFAHLGSRPAAAEYHNLPADYGIRPGTVVPAGEHVVPRHEYYYERETRPRSTLVPQGVSRMYRVREPAENARHQYGISAAPAARVVSVHREARPSEFRDAESARIRDASPRRVEPYGRASPSVAYRPPEHRRVVYRGTSASGYEPQSSGGPPGPARPLFYEFTPAQPVSWHGSTFVQPERSVSYQQQGPESFRDARVRRPVQEAAPLQGAQATYYQRGNAYHERTPSGHLNRAATSNDPGGVEYLYEQQAPPRDVIVIR